ncbi:MAG TPA: hypothetical protein VKB19_19150 [Pedobacter sp.]|nr:hypothetical protein [Pedobacter sp.]
MKKYILLVLAVSAISFAGCGSGDTSSESSDSTMMDTSVVDTMGMGGTTTDTSMTGNGGQDTTMKDTAVIQ